MASSYSTSRNAASPPAAAASAQPEQETEEDFNTSPPGLWLPQTVIKRDRKEATVIWVSLLIAFSAYVGYIVWESINARTNPAASVTVKQEHFKFPDVAVCANFLTGCLSQTVHCLEGKNFTMSGQWGFMEEPSEFDQVEHPEVTRIAEAFPGCAVMPLSRLTVNDTGVNNGDITFFWTSFNIQWDEDPLGEFDATEHPFHTQSINVNFIDIDQDLEQIGEDILDARLPYDRVLFTKDEWVVQTQNSMLVTLSEFSGITSTGKRKEVERTFLQSTTSSKLNRYWTSPSSSDAVSFLHIEMNIAKFEYTSIEEVDPVDGWAIIGAIGGVWQIVVIAFGIFFVFSEKQPPDMKMRNFYEVVTTPVVNINKRFSRVTSKPRQQNGGQVSKGSNQLPPGWLARADDGGRTYYVDTVGKFTQWERPAWRAHTSDDDMGVETVDVPMAYTRRGLKTSYTRALKSTAAPEPASDDCASHLVENVTFSGSSIPREGVTDRFRSANSGAPSTVTTGDVMNELPQQNRGAATRSKI